MTTIKGFIKDYNGNPLLPITRAELVLDKNGMPALHSAEFVAHLPDASTNFAGLPGLITAAEKALIHTLDGDSGSGTISEIYSQIGTLFNIGLKVNDTTLSFYDTTKQATPISFINSANIAVTSNGNEITIDLVSKNYGNTVEQIVNKIEVDEFGRVTNVNGSNTLTGIVINNGTVSESITSNSADLAIANKSYVDDKFAAANSVALGALKFDGVIATSTKLEEIWNSKNAKVNYYYKIGFDAVISADKFHDNVEKSAKLGDTLIVYKQGEVVKFVHIPSGDEPITSITVKDSSNKGIDKTVGSVAFNFTAPFVVADKTDGKVEISLPTLAADNEVGVGLLSRTDYNNFKTYSAKSIQYIPQIKSDSADSYKIGDINFGDGNSVIYGQNTTYALGLTNGYDSGEDLVKNPKLVLTPSSGNGNVIQFIGSDGIRIEKNTNSINFTPNVTTDTPTYITVKNGSVVGVNLGRVGENGSVENGLIDYETTVNYVAAVNQTAAHFTPITNSLDGTETSTTYCYGGDKLKNIITIEI
jgi:hypothetical protein